MRNVFLILFLTITSIMSWGQVDFPFANYVNLGEIERCDSILVVSKTGARQFVFQYQYNLLRSVLFIDTTTTMPDTWQYYRYDLKNVLQEVEYRECIHHRNSATNTIVKCAEAYIVCSRQYIYADNGDIKREVIRRYFRGVEEEFPSVVEYQYHYDSLVKNEDNGRFKRTTVMKFDKNQRLIFQKWLNGDGQKIYEFSIRYEPSRRAIIEKKMFRDLYEDVAVPERCYVFEIEYNKKGLPIRFTGGNRTLLFEYYYHK